MAIQQPRTVGAVADLRVAVPRDAAGDLVDGVETVVGRVESVAAVTGVDVTGVTPRLNDLAVEARVEVSVDVADVEVDGGAVAVGDDHAGERPDGDGERAAAEPIAGDERVTDPTDGALATDGAGVPADAVAAALDEGFGVEVDGVAVT